MTYRHLGIILGDDVALHVLSAGESDAAGLDIGLNVGAGAADQDILGGAVETVGANIGDEAGHVLSELPAAVVGDDLSVVIAVVPLLQIQLAVLGLVGGIAGGPLLVGGGDQLVVQVAVADLGLDLGDLTGQVDQLSIILGLCSVAVLIARLGPGQSHIVDLVQVGVLVNSLGADDIAVLIQEQLVGVVGAGLEVGDVSAGSLDNRILGAAHGGIVIALDGGQAALDLISDVGVDDLVALGNVSNISVLDIGLGVEANDVVVVEGVNILQFDVAGHVVTGISLGHVVVHIGDLGGLVEVSDNSVNVILGAEQFQGHAGGLDLAVDLAQLGNSLSSRHGLAHQIVRQADVQSALGNVDGPVGVS